MRRLLSLRISYRQLILTFALAFATWFVINSGNQYEFDEVIPVRVRGLSEQDRILVSSDLPEVTTRIRGRGWSLWREFLFQRAWYDLSLAEEQNSTINIDLQPEQVIIPAATNLAPVAVLRPRQLQLQIDDIASRILKVEPQLELDLMPGYRLVGEPTVTPDSVELTAPASVLDSVTVIRTELIERTGLNAPLAITAPLAVPFNHLSTARKEVRVELDVQPLLEKSFANLEVEVDNLPAGTSILVDPPVLTVRLAGSSGAVRDLAASELAVRIDFNEWSPESPQLQPVITHPEGVDLIDTTPSRIKIRLIVE